MGQTADGQPVDIAPAQLAADLILALRRRHQDGRPHGGVCPAAIRVADGAFEALGDADAPRPYLAPERGDGPPDVAGDIYALGRTLFVLFTGEEPQPGDLPSHLVPVAPLVDRLYAASHVRRDRRYPSIDALLDEILPARPPSGQVDAAAIAAALSPTDAATTTAPERAPDRIDPLSRPVPPPPPEALARLEAQLDDGERAMQEATAATRLVVTVGGLIVTGLTVLVASWPGLLVFPLFILLRMVQGDLRQRTWFVDEGRPALLAFCETEDHPPLFVWQHVVTQPDRWPTTGTWIRTCEEDFLPEPMRSAPRRMGGVSRVPE